MFDVIVEIKSNLLEMLLRFLTELCLFMPYMILNLTLV